MAQPHAELAVTVRTVAVPGVPHAGTVCVTGVTVSELHGLELAASAPVPESVIVPVPTPVVTVAWAERVPALLGLN